MGVICLVLIECTLICDLRPASDPAQLLDGEAAGVIFSKGSLFY